MGSDDRQRESIDDLDALLASLPPEIVAAVHALPDRVSLIEVVMDLGRRPEARFPDAEVTLLDREIVRSRHRLRGRAHRDVRRRQPGGHRADAPPDQRDPQPQRQDRRADLPDRPGGVRHDRDHQRLRRDREVDPDHGPPGDRQDDDAARGRPRAGRQHRQARGGGRHQQRDRRRRRHPAPGHRQGAADAGPDPVAPARGDDRGGREPHAPGHRHRRDRDGAGGPGRADHRRARRPADRHGPRQQPRQPDAQPDAVRPDRRDPERHPRRRGGAPPADPEERPRAQGAADLRRDRRDPGPRTGHGPRRRGRHDRRDAARRPGRARAPLAGRGGRPSQPGPAAAVASRAARRRAVRRPGRCRLVVADGARLARRGLVPLAAIARRSAAPGSGPATGPARRWLAPVPRWLGSRAGDPRARLGGWLGRHPAG